MNIEKKYKEVLKELSVLMDCPWESPEFYANWLSQSYFYTSHGPEVLLMAAAYCPPEQRGLQRRLTVHSGEEKGHEILAKRDLADLGYTPEGFGEYAMTNALYTTQLYKIQNKSVEPLMGWVLMLEGIAITYGGAIRDRVAKVKMPTRFLDIHVDEDPDHVESAFKAIEALGPAHQQEIIKNMEMAKDMYVSILEACKKQALKMKTASRKAS